MGNEADWPSEPVEEAGDDVVDVIIEGALVLEVPVVQQSLLRGCRVYCTEGVNAEVEAVCDSGKPTRPSFKKLRSLH